MIDDAFLGRQTLLVIAPHADDESISSAGLLWRVKRAGGKTFVMVASASRPAPRFSSFNRCAASRGLTIAPPP